MTDWRLAFAKNCLKTALPFKNQLRAWRARRSSAPVPDHFYTVIEGAIGQVRILQDVSFDLRGKRALEIGSGWYPIMPLVFRLGGAQHVVLSDAEPLIQGANLVKTVAFLRKHKAQVLEGLGISDAEFERVLGVELSGDRDAMLAQLGLSYVMVNDGWSRVPEVDIVFSHTCLEHIPPHILESVFADSKRVLRPGGIISHGIDHSDHRSHIDPNLSRIDFLRYSDATWRLLCIDPLDYTNRLRHSAYVAMIKAAGFDLLLENAIRDGRIEEQVKTLPLWGRFQNLSQIDLHTTWSHLIARPI